MSSNGVAEAVVSLCLLECSDTPKTAPFWSALVAKKRYQALHERMNKSFLGSRFFDDNEKCKSLEGCSKSQMFGPDVGMEICSEGGFGDVYAYIGLGLSSSGYQSPVVV